MVSVTASTLSDLIDDNDLEATDAEKIIDHAIDLLNLYSEIDEDIPNMSGTAGSKTLTVQGYERGAIITVARVIYKSFFKNEDGGSVGLGLASNSSAADLMANPNVLAMVQAQAQLLASRRTDSDEIEVSVG
jgi:hypothetical protein